VVEIRFVEKC